MNNNHIQNQIDHDDERTNLRRGELTNNNQKDTTLAPSITHRDDNNIATDDWELTISDYDTKNPTEKGDFSKAAAILTDYGTINKRANTTNKQDSNHAPQSSESPGKFKLAVNENISEKSSEQKVQNKPESDSKNKSTFVTARTHPYTEKTSSNNSARKFQKSPPKSDKKSANESKKEIGEFNEEKEQFSEKQSEPKDKTVEEKKKTKQKCKEKCKERCNKKCRYLAFVILSIIVQVIVLVFVTCSNGNELAITRERQEKIGLWENQSPHTPDLLAGKILLIFATGVGVVFLICLLLCLVKKIEGRLAFILLFITAILQYITLLASLWYLGCVLRKPFRQVGWCYILPLVGFILAHFMLVAPFHPACINPSSANEHSKSSKTPVKSKTKRSTKSTKT